MHLVHDPAAAPQAEIDFGSFLTVDMRVGTVIKAEPFPEARKPAIKLLIDFGDGVGEKKSSAQITAHYQPKDLVGRQVVAVVNFPPRQIGPFISEVLVLGAADSTAGIVLLAPDQPVPNGARIA
ncbi:putative chaperone [Parvularcula bermudensis HTCC2503]|uniref:Putative chaperone n=1 Tax=Parvularcula bermudensis (strain ATCC BAA-594 / HTCC2503 / KCTC 12087) TaxID=314260 RepID=E0TG65_PARBH|nr:tRNA-binding protein [Parvularcula bermudensis]ADM10636.1 putative chaperone [Parvularcula bermudensis HTCC2503]